MVQYQVLGLTKQIGLTVSKTSISKSVPHSLIKFNHKFSSFTFGAFTDDFPI